MLKHERDSLWLSGILPRPFEDGEDGGDDDSASGSGGRDNNSRDAGGSRDDDGEPLTLDAIDKLIERRLGPINERIEKSDTWRQVVNRKLKLGGRRSSNEEDDNDTGDSGTGTGKSNREKREAAADRRLAQIEDRAAKTSIKGAIGDGLDGIDDKDLIPGAKKTIRRLVAAGAVYDADEDEVYFDDGETQVPIAEAIKAEAANAMFRRASSRKGGGGGGGENAGKGKDATGFEDLSEDDINNMSDEDFAKLRQKQQRRWNQGGGRRIY